MAITSAHVDVQEEVCRGLCREVGGRVPGRLQCGQLQTRAGSANIHQTAPAALTSSETGAEGQPVARDTCSLQGRVWGARQALAAAPCCAVRLQHAVRRSGGSSSRFHPLPEDSACSTAQRNTAHRSVTQHSTAHRSTAQHSTAQHSVAHLDDRHLLRGQRRVELDRHLGPLQPAGQPRAASTRRSAGTACVRCAPAHAPAALRRLALHLCLHHHPLARGLTPWPAT